MRGTSRRVGRVLGLTLALAFAYTPLRASAQAGEPEPPSEYHQLIERALVESAASRWPEALALFRQAHAVYPNARTHRGIGMVAYEVRDYVEALRHLSLALGSERRPLDEAQRAEVTQLLERTRVFVGRYELSRLPPDATLSVDGKLAEREADGTLVLALGAHRVEVRATAPERAGSAQLQVRGGEHEPLPLVLEVVPQAPAPVTTTPVEVPGPKAELASAPLPAEQGPTAATAARAPDAGAGSSVAPIVLTATGGAVLIAGAVLLIAGLGDLAKVEDAPEQARWSKLQAADDRAPLMTGLGIGLLGAGGALVLTGGVLWLGHGEDSDGDGALDGMSLRMRACF